MLNVVAEKEAGKGVGPHSNHQVANGKKLYAKRTGRWICRSPHFYVLVEQLIKRLWPVDCLYVTYYDLLITVSDYTIQYTQNNPAQIKTPPYLELN